MGDTMNQKLTLSIEQNTIERAKQYAKCQGRSLSSMVEDFLLLLDSPETPDEIVPIGSKLSSLVGIGTGTIDEEDYRAHLIQKNNQ